MFNKKSTHRPVLIRKDLQEKSNNFTNDIFSGMSFGVGSSIGNAIGNTITNIGNTDSSKDKHCEILIKDLEKCKKENIDCSHLENIILKFKCR